MDSVGQTLHPECQDGGQPGKGNGGGKEGVAEPGKNQKYWTPEASSLGAVNTRPHLYPTFPAWSLAGRSEAALEGWRGAAAPWGGGGEAAAGLGLTSLHRPGGPGQRAVFIPTNLTEIHGLGPPGKGAFAPSGLLPG